MTDTEPSQPSYDDAAVHREALRGGELVAPAARDQVLRLVDVDGRGAASSALFYNAASRSSATTWPTR